MLSEKNIKDLAKEFGEDDIKMEDMLEMLERASTNGKEISEDDFYHIMLKKLF